MVGYHAGNEVNLMSGRLLDAVPLSSLTGVGAAQSSKLAKIGLHTVQDLLLHLPLHLLRFSILLLIPVALWQKSSCLQVRMF